MTDRSEPFKPAAEHRISRLDTVRVLADPLRLRLLEAMASRLDEPWTVKELARALGEPPTKLYYHVNLLEEHGILVVTGSRLVSGIVEKRYQLVAANISVDQGVLSTGEHGVDEALHSVLSTIFGGAGEDIQRSIHAGVASLHRESDDPAREPVILSKGIDRLTPERAAELRERLKALIAEFGETPGQDSSEKRHQPLYGLVVAFYPMADVPSPGARIPRRKAAHPEERR
jgi:DNA-binding transcriptional ArsR family regulator